MKNFLNKILRNKKEEAPLTFKEQHILIIEDDKALADMLTSMLGQQNFIISVAYHANQVKDLLTQTPFDLVFLDIMLPGKSGFEVLKDFKKDPKTRKIPVIIMTNLGEVEYMEKGLNLGAADYLIKVNMSAEKINQIVHKHLTTMDARYNLHME